jgi:hypothetical protein
VANRKRILPTPASSTDVERLFFSVWIDMQRSLSPEHVNMLASLNTWINDDFGYRSARSESSILSATRFVSINVDLEFIQQRRTYYKTPMMKISSSVAAYSV